MNTNFKFKDTSRILLLALILISMACTPVFADKGDKSSIDAQEETVVITVEGENTAAEIVTAETQNEDDEDVTLSSVDIEPPTAPYDLHVYMVTETTITIKWSASLDNQGVFEYRIYKNFVEIGTSDSPTFLLTDMIAEEYLLITVRAIDYSGNISDSSNILCVYHTVGETVSGVTLAMPTGLQINKVWDNNLTLVWQSAESGSDISYEIYNGSSLVGTTSQKQYIVTGLQNGSSYSLKVRTKNLDGSVSDFSSTVSYTHDINYVALPPSAPQNLKADSVTNNTVTLKWDGNAINVLEYVVYDDDRIMGITSANSYAVTGLVNEDTYTFTVRAKAYDGALSDASNTVFLYHINGDVQNPLNVTAEAKTENDLITIMGSALANNIVTMTVRNIENIVVYTASTVCGINSRYNFNFTMPETCLVGVYTATVIGEGSMTSATVSYQYNIARMNELSAVMGIDNILSVSGSTTLHEGKTVSLSITRQGSNMPVFENALLACTLGDGSFAFEPITIPPSASSGIYTVTVVCEGISVPMSKMFKYGAQNISDISIQVEDDTVTVNGIACGKTKEGVTILIRDINERIVYLNQCECNENGSFEFICTMPNDAVIGRYTVMIGGKDVLTPETLMFNYEYTVYDVESAHFNANITIQNYVTTINGTIECERDKKVIFLVKKQNTEYINEEIVEIDGERSFTCTLPSLFNSATYIMQVKIYEITSLGDIEISSLSANISTGILTVSIDGTAYCGDGQKIIGTVKETQNNLIDKTEELTGNKEFSYTLPTVLCAGKFNVNAVFYEKCTTGAIINAESLVNGNIITINGDISSGNNNNVTILVNDINDNVVYEGQTTSGTSGSFVFTFTMPDDAVSGDYTVMISGAYVVTPGIFNFTYTSQNLLTASVTVGADQIIVTGITGRGEGKTATLNVTRQGESTSLISKTAVTSMGGSYTFTILASELPSNGEYSATVSIEGIEATVTKNFVYPQPVSQVLIAPIILPLQSEDLRDTTVNLSWYRSEGGTGVITYSIYVNGNMYESNISSTSFEVSNLLPQTSYDIKVVACDTSDNEAESDIINITTREEGSYDNVPLYVVSKQEYIKVIGTITSSNKKITLRVRNYYDNIIYETIGNCTSYGMVNLQFQMPEDSPGGTYKVTVLSDTDVLTTTFIYSDPVITNASVNISKSKTVNVSNGVYFTVYCDTKNISNISNKKVTVTYNNSEVQLVEANLFTMGTIDIQNTSGNITITSFVPGILEFTVANPVFNNIYYNGVINVLKFKGITEGTTSLNIAISDMEEE